jgi:hypothetical protein
MLTFVGQGSSPAAGVHAGLFARSVAHHQPRSTAQWRIETVGLSDPERAFEPMNVHRRGIRVDST